MGGEYSAIESGWSEHDALRMLRGGQLRTGTKLAWWIGVAVAGKETHGEMP
jgi:hypothetical protein